MVATEVAPGVHRLEDAFTNWYLLEDESGVTVVDAGVPTSWSTLTAGLDRIGRSLFDVRALVLTHAHFDHVGIAERIRRELGVPVYLHENDVPIARHPWRYDHERARLPYFLTQLRAMPIVATLVRNRAFWPPAIGALERFSDDAGTLSVPGRPTVIPTPGHTLGHCALQLADRDCVIVGDAIVTLDPYTARRGPRVVARAATADSERNLRTLDALVETDAGTLLPGHGDPWTLGVASAVEAARAAPVA